MRKVRARGVSVVELLIVLAVLGAVLAVLTAFFGMQANTSSRVQAGNEVEINVRTAAEIVTQDLQMAGSRIVVDNSGESPVITYVDKILDHCNPLKGSTSHCVVVAGGQITMYYASSLRLATDPCRRVDYRLDGTVLMRSEVACSGDPAVDNSDLQPFAENVQEFTVSFQCQDGASVTDPADCYATEDNFPLQAQVTISAVSANQREAREATVTLSTTMHNMRPVAVSE